MLCHYLFFFWRGTAWWGGGGGGGRMSSTFNPFPDDRILAFPKLKPLTNDNFNEAQMVKLFFDNMKNVVRKGGNADYQYFTSFPEVFSKDLCPMER